MIISLEPNLVSPLETLVVTNQQRSLRATTALFIVFRTDRMDIYLRPEAR